MKLEIECDKCGEKSIFVDDNEILKEVTYRVEDNVSSCCAKCFEEYQAKRDIIRNESVEKYKRLNLEYLGRE